MRRLFAILALGAVAPLLPVGALACRYNVRDVGFVDFENETYRLFVVPGPHIAPAEAERIREAARVALKDSNVAFEIVPEEAPDTHPARPHRAALPSTSLPAAVLVPTDGNTTTIPLSDASGRVVDDLAGTFERLVDSPTRNALLASMARAFGAILLIEGTDADANAKARRTIAEAIDQIRGHMKSLPKPIEEPPGLQVLEPASLSREAVLLRTLRQDTRPTTEPRAAVFYGRGRWIGPLMRGEEIATRNLVGLFSIVGADCECGYDLAWTLGTRLPQRWPESLHAPVAKALGFDPENPLIKLEIGTIVSRRGTLQATGGSRASGSANGVPAPSSASSAPPVTAATPSPEA
ncbi:MAG: hypothetical protein JNL97_17845, partial [Verrucomicrobiales bacterium]|nr:hypothetical protein [Verrucomicrobiales bacterium]